MSTTRPASLVTTLRRAALGAAATLLGLGVAFAPLQAAQAAPQEAGTPPVQAECGIFVWAC